MAMYFVTIPGKSFSTLDAVVDSRSAPVRR